jgi:hypothetical protein
VNLFISNVSAMTLQVSMQRDVPAGHPEFYSSLSSWAQPSTPQFYTAKTAKQFSGKVGAWVEATVWAPRVS